MPSTLRERYVCRSSHRNCQLSLCIDPAATPAEWSPARVVPRKSLLGQSEPIRKPSSEGVSHQDDIQPELRLIIPEKGRRLIAA